MAFLPLIRDYFDFFPPFDEFLTSKQVINFTFDFFFQNFKNSFFYLVTFDWFKDFLFLKNTIPRFDILLPETLFFKDFLKNLFQIDFLENLEENEKFLLGFFNSFFLALPFSCSQIISFRFFFIQGVFAGFAASLGNIFGQFFFFLFLSLGGRNFFFPFFFNDIIFYICGLWFLVKSIYTSGNELTIKIISWTNTKQLFKIFFINFLLMWTQECCFFPYLSKLNLDQNSTNLVGQSEIDYFFGLFYGFFLFYFLFFIFFKKFLEILQISFNLLKSRIINYLNNFLLVGILLFSFTSIPFFSADFVFTNSLGFIPQDKNIEKTFLSSSLLYEPIGWLKGFYVGTSLGEIYRFTVDFDTVFLDNGSYIKKPAYDSFEARNLQYRLLTKQGKIPLYDRYTKYSRQLLEYLFPEYFKTKDIQKKKKKKRKKKGIILPMFSEFVTFYSNFPYLIRWRYSKARFSRAKLRLLVALTFSLNHIFPNIKYEARETKSQKKLRKRYYNNFHLNFLLKKDIDFFLNRQPYQYLLSKKEEKELYKKRLILSRYSDTFRFYQDIDYRNVFEYFFCGSKSFSDRVYNQQFKGTVRIVKKLFVFSFSEKKIKIQTKKKKNKKRKRKFKKKKMILKYDQLNYNKKKSKKFFFHEELKKTRKKKQFFLKSINQNPFYIGWDDMLGRVFLTNKLLPRSLAGFFKNFNFTKRKMKKIFFTSWPLFKFSFFLNNSNLFFVTKEKMESLEVSWPKHVFRRKTSKLSLFRILPKNFVRLHRGPITQPNGSGWTWPGKVLPDFFLEDF